MAERPASERHEWQIPLSQGEIDRCGLGVIDERAKTFPAAERRVAEHLATPGPAIVSVSEGFGIYGRTADARVNGISVEFKSLDPGASDRTVKAALNSAKGQARHAVIDARDSGLTEDQAHRGVRRFSGTPREPAWRRARHRGQLHHRLEASPLRLLEDAAGDVDVLVPGHGSIGGADQVQARIDQDRAYVRALRDARGPSDPRVGPSATFDWVPGVHARQLQILAQRSERDGTPG